MNTKTIIDRGHYKEIKMDSLNPITRKKVTNLFEEAKKSQKVDEHGNWEFGCDFDSAGRGHALNWDLYAYGRDIHSKKLLIVIQIRQYVKQRRNGYANIRKSYFLVGRNEDQSAFAHSVESRVIHSAINAKKNVIRACQNWIFQVDYSKVLRQGDLALVPVKRAQGELSETKSLLIEDSHEVNAELIYVDKNIYALNPQLLHLPNTHPEINAQGWYKIIIGKRADYWTFAAPTID